ncbi:MAG: hypothetical protein WBB28_27945 [Crinalium sp.]
MQSPYNILPPLRLQFHILQVLTELFTLGIFSVQGGAKAWFELLLVTATLFACGYLAWWQLIFILIALILGTLAAGIFSIIAPQYVSNKNDEVHGNKSIATLFATNLIVKFSQNKVQEVDELSEKGLVKHLEKLEVALEIFTKYPDLVEVLPEIAIAVNNTNQGIIYSKQKQDRLNQQRIDKGFTGGCPPEDRYDPPRCPHGYPIKVTLNKPDKLYHGIIWIPTDTEYKRIKPEWCFESVQEALNERGKYRFRRPKDNKGRLRN